VDLDRWFDAVTDLIWHREAGTWVSYGMLVLAAGFLTGTWAAWLLEKLEDRRTRRGPRQRTYRAAAADHATNLLAMVISWAPRPRPPRRGMIAVAVAGWVTAFGSLLVDFRIAYPAAGVGTVALVVDLWRRYRWARLLELRERDTARRQEEDRRKREAWAAEQTARQATPDPAPAPRLPRRYPAPV
jgi:hypothetical protein